MCELLQRNTVTAGDYGSRWAPACTTSTQAAKFLASLLWCSGTEYQTGDLGVIGSLYLSHPPTTHPVSLFSVVIFKDPGEAEASPEFELLRSGGVSQRVLRTGTWSLETVPSPPCREGARTARTEGPLLLEQGPRHPRSR